MGSKQTILLVADFYPPFTGGSELQIQLLGRQLQKRGYSVHVATLWHSGLPTEEDDQGVTVHRLKGLVMRVPFLFKDPGQRRYHPPFPDPLITLALHRLLQDIHPNVIHTFGWMTYSSAIAAIGKKIPLLVSARDFGYICAVRTLLFMADELCDGPQPLKCLRCATQDYGLPKAAVTVLGVRFGRLLLKRTVHGFHTSSSYVKNVITRYFPSVDTNQDQSSSTPYSVIPNISQDVEHGTKKPGILESLPKVPFILFVGALQPHKGIYPLLTAYTKLHAPPPLVLMGTTWPDSPKAFPPGVTVIENVPHDAVMEAWSSLRLRRGAFAVPGGVWQRHR